MITTVTTSTISTITSVTATIGFGIAIGIVAVVALLAFFSARELAAASENHKYRFLARSLDVAIAPLIIAFIIIVAVKMMEILA